MNIEDAKIIFGEWLPDRPYYDNPGLVEAKNCIPVDDSYKDFYAFSGANATLTAAPKGAFAAIDSSGNPKIYVGTATSLFEEISGTWTVRAASTYNASSYWQFAQFDNYVFATDYNDRPLYNTIGAAANFATLTGAPFGRHLGVINRFLMLGDIADATTTPFRVQWASIDNPLDWPTPGTSTALARQAGEQYLDSSFGAVTGIANGQFWGLVFQQRGISRFTYIGGDAVFQIDTFERSRGLWAPRSLAQIGNVCYFIAVDGVYVTDGQSVTPIGDGKVDKWLFSALDQSSLSAVTKGVDWINKCIYWSFPITGGSGNPTRIIVYNFARNRWSWAEVSLQMLFSSFSTGYTLDQLDSLFTSIDDMSLSFDSAAFQGGTPVVSGFYGGQRGSFAGSSLTALFETGELEPNSFGLTFVRGTQPIVTGSPTTISVSIGYRATQHSASRTFSTGTSPNSRTGICPSRVTARFVSTRTTVTGGFDRAVGIGLDIVMSDLV